MSYRGTGFLAVERFGSTPTPLPLSPISKLLLFRSLPNVSPVELTDGRGVGGDGLGAELYDRKKAWPSINHSILIEIIAPCIDARSLTTRSACLNRTFGCGVPGFLIVD